MVLPLRYFESLDELKPFPSKPDNYISRSMYRKTNLKSQLREDFESKTFKDHLCFSEDEYKKFLLCNPVGTVHLVEEVPLKKDAATSQTQQQGQIDISHLVWKKSRHSLQHLRDYFKKKTSKINENSFSCIETFNPLILISGQAGMGKSSFMENLAYNLKQKFPECWVQKFASFFEGTKGA